MVGKTHSNVGAHKYSRYPFKNMSMKNAKIDNIASFWRLEMAS